MRTVVFCFLLTICCVYGKEGFGPGEQDWGFVTVREKAHIFWWFYNTTANVENTKKPLILWLQGGPGSSSTGFGNFAEIGPLDTNLDPRAHNWMQYANVLLVDNPVGTGFSYVEDESLLVTNNSQIADDFMVFLKEFFEQHSEFENVPFYIFTESYGGKMTVEITLRLTEEIKKENIKCNLTGIALGNSWISSVDSVMNYAPFLLGMGIIDNVGFRKIDKVAQQLPDLVAAGKYAEAFAVWRAVEYEINTHTYGVDMYNVITKKIARSSIPGPINPDSVQTGVPSGADSKINDIMNNRVREALNITQPWGTQNEMVFDTLTGKNGDFMAPVVDIVELLLNTTDVKISVYTGMLDLICNTPGTISWINKMNWKDKENWVNAERKGFANNDDNYYYEGYEKKAKNFALYWIVNSGHMVPADNPYGMYRILKDITDNFRV